VSYTIIDNFLEKSHLEEIQRVYLSDTMPWCMGIVNENDKANTYFVHHIHSSHTIVTNFSNPIKPIIDKINPRALMRVKANLYARSDNLIIHAPHIDYDYEHKAAIFYINTNDGFTIINDGTKVKSVANRLLMFEAHKEHQSTNCTDERARVNINFNYF
tara:strand:- start:2330 stop:2806 length:477 start_codon:yes stop_codon:yes gene_type:complete